MTKVRRATAADLEALDRLGLTSFDAERRRLLAAAIGEGTCHVVLHGGAVAGYVVFNTGFFHRRFIELIAVGAEFRRQGLASALVDYCLALVPGTQVWTSTNQSNTAMQALLARTGFVPSGRIDNLDADDPELIYVHPPGVTPVESAAR